MGVTPDFLKHYEECGLLDVHHRENGYRYFNFDQCSRILEYMRLRNYNRIKTLQREISRLANQTRNAKHFLTVPGIGETIMAYMCVLLADPAQFSSGRQFAAYLGLVPMHTGSGGKTVTTKIPGRCESSASFVGTGSSCGGQVEMPDRLGEDHFGKETQEGGNGCHRQPHGTPVLGGGKQGTGLEKDAC